MGEGGGNVTPNVSQRLGKYPVRGQIWTESQGSKWDARRVQRVLASKHSEGLLCWVFLSEYSVIYNRTLNTVLT